MTLLDQIRKDREAARSQMPWYHSPWHIEEGPDAVKSPNGEVICNTSGEVDARRIARTPQLEEALLAAEAMAEAFKRGIDDGVVNFDPAKTLAALAAFKSAVEGDT